MLYRTAGQFKTSYAADHALFPVRQDAWLLGVILVFAFVIFPLTASEFAFKALLIPVLIYSLAALGLNILTGYAGQLSLGTGAFMGVGAYACYKLITVFPELSPIAAILLSGLFSAGIGVAFGLPSLRIKGFYLAIATLAAQFFLVWLFEKWAWLYNYNSSGAIQVPTVSSFGVPVFGPNALSIVQYYVVLGVVTVVTIAAINITRGRIGRIWKSVRDMDIAAELVGINLMKAKLSAFAVSSYIIGRSEEHTSELQSQSNLVCRLLLEKKKKTKTTGPSPPASTMDCGVPRAPPNPPSLAATARPRSAAFPLLGSS